MTFDPSGAAFYAGDYADGSIYRLAATGGTVGPLSTLSATPLSGNPAGLAFTADGRLYLARATAGDVVELNLSTGAMLRTLAAGFMLPRGLAVDPISGDLFFTASNGALERISHPTAVTPTVSAYALLNNPDGVVFAPDGTAYAVDVQATTENVVRIAATNSATPGAESVIAPVPGADGIAVGANPTDHSRPPFLAVNRTDGTITLIDLASSAQSQIATGGSRGDFATVGPDGCLYATQTDRIAKITAADGSCPFGHRFEPISPFLPPGALTGAAIQVTLTTVTLNGVLNSHATDTSANFDYGPTSAYGSSTAPVDAGVGSSDTATAAAVSGLQPCATYHFRLVAQSRAGITAGGDQTFQTVCPPAVGQAPTPSPPQTAPCPIVGRQHQPPTAGRRNVARRAARRPAPPRSAKRPPARPVLLLPRARARVHAGLVSFKWRPAARATGYILMIDHHRMKTGCRTAAAIVDVGHHRYRVIATNRYGTKSSRQQAFIAISPPSVNEIRRGLGLDVLDSSVIAEAERITLKAAEAAAFRRSLLALGKVASRASIFLFLLSIGLENGNLDCEQGPLYMAAKPVFTEAAAVLARAGRAGVGPRKAIVAELAAAQSRINGLKSFIAQNHVVKECEGPNKVALNTIQALEPTLNAAKQRLDKLAASQEPSKTNTKKFKEKCMTAMKLLTRYASLFTKVNRGRPIDPKKKKELDSKRDAGTITSKDLPGSLMDVFPGEFKGLSLKRIRELCK